MFSVRKYFVLIKVLEGIDRSVECYFLNLRKINCVDFQQFILSPVILIDSKIRMLSVIQTKLIIRTKLILKIIENKTFTADH